ncbi:MAG: LCP family protein [Clostridia bacterium]|jgi:polyisoprenyl-teichoic acid--peptidoglycan teichoic acid transferase|nr:LCP family protein [Clostridia bacterium]MBT7122660.1 LCP family protein [Clostridia bacterium]
MEIEDVKYKKKRKRSTRFKVVLSIFIILLVVLIGVALYFIIDFSKIWGDLGFNEGDVTYDILEDENVEGLEEVDYISGDVQTIGKEDGILDILLIGVDSRSTSKFTGRSDVLMVLRIDTNTNEIKLASFMRDTLVQIEGHDKNRINTAYHFGSIELTNLTLESNFGITPDYYVVVNFYGMEDIINALGGVDIDVQSNEVKYVNGSVDELNSIDNDGKSAHISGSGMQRLNGRQAVAYMRIRKVGGDAARVKRQQTVLNELFKEAASIDLSQVPSMIGVLTDYVRTDIPLGEMVNIGTAVLKMDVSELQRFTYPDKYDIGNYKGMSIVQPANYEEEMDKLVNFLES